MPGRRRRPDFTERLAADLTGRWQRQQLAATGYADLPNCYDDGQPYRIGRHMLEEVQRTCCWRTGFPCICLSV